MSRMIWTRRSSVYSKDQESLEAFCCISRALVATPPALAAFPGPKATPPARSTSTAPGVQGRFAPSATINTPFSTSIPASSWSSSFCVAQGSATSVGSSQSRPPGTKREPGRRAA